MLHHTVGPLDDEMTPSPMELQSEDEGAVRDHPLTMKQAKNVEGYSHCNASIPNKKSTSLSPATVTNCSKDGEHSQGQRREEDTSDKLSNEVPLKQRLRSAKLHKSNAASGKGTIFLM
jgi:hypothetical protein